MVSNGRPPSVRNDGKGGAFSYSCQGVGDAKVFCVLVDIANELVGELSPFSVYWLVTRNSTRTLEDTGSFFCSQFPGGIFESRLHSCLRLFYPLVSCIIYLLCDQQTRPLFHVTSLEEWVVNELQSPCSHAEVPQSVSLSRSASHRSGSFSSEYSTSFFFRFVLFASTLHSFQLWLYGPFFFVYQPLWPFQPLSLLHLIDRRTAASWSARF